MMEGTMQHWKEVESRESSESLIPDPDSAQALGPPNTAAARHGQAVVATTLVGSGPSKPDVQGAAVELGRPRGQLANVLEDLGQDPERLLEHSEDLQPGGGARPPRREEYAYIVTNK
eukprot:g27745.t1